MQTDNRADEYSKMCTSMLVSAAQNGDGGAFDYLIRLYRGRISSLCSRYYLAGAEHDDLVQEGLIGFYLGVKTYDPSAGEFCAYAMMCAKRRILDAVKSAARLKHAPLNSCLSLDETFSDGDGGSVSMYELIAERCMTDPETIIIDREFTDSIKCRLNKALSKLELQVLIYYLEGRSYQEISGLINRDIKSVDNAVWRTRKKLEYIFYSGKDNSSV